MLDFIIMKNQLQLYIIGILGIQYLNFLYFLMYRDDHKLVNIMGEGK